MSCERYLCVMIPVWRKKTFKTTEAFIVCIGCICIIALINSHVLFTFGFDVVINGTYNRTACFVMESEPSTHWKGTWCSVHSFLYSYVPSGILIITNALLCWTLYRKKKINKSARKQRKQKSLTLTIVFITIPFMLLTGFGSVVNFFMPELLPTYKGNVIIVIGDTLCALFHSLNILSLILTNKRFREELLRLKYFKNSQKRSKLVI